MHIHMQFSSLAVDMCLGRACSDGATVLHYISDRQLQLKLPCFDNPHDGVAKAWGRSRTKDLQNIGQPKKKVLNIESGYILAAVDTQKSPRLLEYGINLLASKAS